MKSQKKIIFVITKSNFGGAQRYVLDMALECKERGYDVIVACGGRGPLVDKLERKKIEVVSIPHLSRSVSLKNDLRSALFLWRLFRKEKPSIVHLNSSKAGLGALAAKFALVPKVIFTLHGLALNEKRPLFQKVLIHATYWLTLLLSNKTIAVSHALKRQSDSLFPLVSRKITVVHNGTAEKNFIPKSESRAHLLSKIPHSDTIEIGAASLTIGTIGELHPIKGHKILLEGFKEASDLSAVPLFLFVLGEGEEREKTEKIIESLELQRKVFLCGHIDEAMLYLKAFDIFILPSYSEGLPYALQEAGLSELPTIATEVGGIPELVIPGKTGVLIPPGSKKAVRDAILELVFDPVLRKSYGENLKKKVLQEFSVSQMADETIALYEK